MILIQNNRLTVAGMWTAMALAALAGNMLPSFFGELPDFVVLTSVIGTFGLLVGLSACLAFDTQVLRPKAEAPPAAVERDLAAAAVQGQGGQAGQPIVRKTI
jgi:FtsH-binding integral membrane protein